MINHLRLYRKPCRCNPTWIGDRATVFPFFTFPKGCVFPLKEKKRREEEKTPDCAGQQFAPPIRRGRRVTMFYEFCGKFIVKETRKPGTHVRVLF